MNKGKITIKNHYKNNNRQPIKQTEKNRQNMNGGTTSIQNITEIQSLQQLAKSANNCSNELKTIKFNSDRKIDCPNDYNKIKKIQLNYHPDKNRGCKQLATNVYQILNETCKNIDKSADDLNVEEEYSNIFQYADTFSEPIRGNLIALIEKFKQIEEQKIIEINRIVQQIKQSNRMEEINRYKEEEEQKLKEFVRKQSFEVILVIRRLKTQIIVDSQIEFINMIERSLIKINKFNKKIFEKKIFDVLTEKYEQIFHIVPKTYQKILESQQKINIILEAIKTNINAIEENLKIETPSSDEITEREYLLLNIKKLKAHASGIMNSMFIDYYFIDDIRNVPDTFHKTMIDSMYQMIDSIYQIIQDTNTKIENIRVNFFQHASAKERALKKEKERLLKKEEELLSKRLAEMIQQYDAEQEEKSPEKDATPPISIASACLSVNDSNKTECLFNKFKQSKQNNLPDIPYNESQTNYAKKFIKILKERVESSKPTTKSSLDISSINLDFDDSSEQHIKLLQGDIDTLIKAIKTPTPSAAQGDTEIRQALMPGKEKQVSSVEMIKQNIKAIDEKIKNNIKKQRYLNNIIVSSEEGYATLINKISGYNDIKRPINSDAIETSIREQRKTIDETKIQLAKIIQQLTELEKIKRENVELLENENAKLEANKIIQTAIKKYLIKRANKLDAELNAFKQNLPKNEQQQQQQQQQKTLEDFLKLHIKKLSELQKENEAQKLAESELFELELAIIQNEFEALNKQLNNIETKQFARELTKKEIIQATREKVTKMTRKLFKIPVNINKTQSIRPLINKYKKRILKANNPKLLESLIGIFKINDNGEQINDYNPDQLDNFIKKLNNLSFKDSIINPTINPTINTNPNINKNENSIYNFIKTTTKQSFPNINNYGKQLQLQRQTRKNK